MDRPRRLRVLDAPVDSVDMAGALSYVSRYLREGTSPGTILAVNPEKVYALRKDPFLMRFFERGTLLLPDGIGVVMALNLLYRAGATRVAGADLMLGICDIAAREGQGIFVYGARERVNRRAVEILGQRFPGIRIVGRANGYLGPQEADDLLRTIAASGAEILFVALGSPAQERWMHEHLPGSTVRICQGIGGTLDTITGDVRRAPAIFRRLGLEWFYRLVRQPSRWRRQIVYPLFVAEVLQQAVRSRTRRGRR
ncbi:MAG: WecB/TagA/CpsF family glycosyltransferase [Chloroflexi bacterium]|nr:WecB/TagA/CpsF family glycosyltransferase [Chloroflexota bacterium]